MHKSNLPKAHQDALDALIAAEAKLIELGYCLFRQAAWYKDEKSAHFSTHLSVPFNKNEQMFDHAFADAIRDLSIEWSNAVHKGQLKWTK